LPNPPTIILLLKTESTTSLKQTLKRTRFSRPWSKGTISRKSQHLKRSNPTHPHTSNLETEMKFHTTTSKERGREQEFIKLGKTRYPKPFFT
jgi:hypothetical protein